jgi:hypothetical protein
MQATLKLPVLSAMVHSATATKSAALDPDEDVAVYLLDLRGSSGAECRVPSFLTAVCQPTMAAGPVHGAGRIF